MRKFPLIFLALFLAMLPLRAQTGAMPLQLSPAGTTSSIPVCAVAPIGSALYSNVSACIATPVGPVGANQAFATIEKADGTVVQVPITDGTSFVSDLTIGFIDSGAGATPIATWMQQDVNFQNQVHYSIFNGTAFPHPTLVSTDFFSVSSYTFTSDGSRGASYLMLGTAILDHTKLAVYARDIYAGALGGSIQLFSGKTISLGFAPLLAKPTALNSGNQMGHLATVQDNSGPEKYLTQFALYDGAADSWTVFSLPDLTKFIQEPLALNLVGGTATNQFESAILINNVNTGFQYAAAIVPPWSSFTQISPIGISSGDLQSAVASDGAYHSFTVGSDLYVVYNPSFGPLDTTANPPVRINKDGVAVVGFSYRLVGGSDNSSPTLVYDQDRGGGNYSLWGINGLGGGNWNRNDNQVLSTDTVVYPVIQASKAAGSVLVAFPQISNANPKGGSVGLAFYNGVHWTVTEPTGTISSPFRDYEGLVNSSSGGRGLQLTASGDATIAWADVKPGGENLKSFTVSANLLDAPAGDSNFNGSRINNRYLKQTNPLNQFTWYGSGDPTATFHNVYYWGQNDLLPTRIASVATNSTDYYVYRQFLTPSQATQVGVITIRAAYLDGTNFVEAIVETASGLLQPQ